MKYCIAAWSLIYIRRHKFNIANLTAKQPPSFMSKSHSRSRLCTFCTWIWLETMLPMYRQNTYYRTQQSLKTSTDYYRRQCKHFCVEPFAWLRHCFFFRSPLHFRPNRWSRDWLWRHLTGHVTVISSILPSFYLAFLEVQPVSWQQPSPALHQSDLCRCVHRLPDTRTHLHVYYRIKLLNMYFTVAL